jgi:F-type H+-transporting ATPase subunit gamma
METIQDIRQRINNTEDLGGIVGTMRALAMTSIRQYEQAVESLVDYNRTTEMGLQVVLNKASRQGVSLPQTNEKYLDQLDTGIIVFGSDQGLCGQFNEQISSYTLNQLEQRNIPLDKRQYIVVGLRVAGSLDHAGQPIDTIYNIPSSVETITPMVQELLLHSQRWRGVIEAQQVGRVLLFYNRMVDSRSESGTTALYRPHMRQLLPIDPGQWQTLGEQGWPSRSLPIFTMAWRPLFSALLRQHLFVTLFRAFAESLASENSARLLAMQAAERNIEERLAELTQTYHQQRQNNITSELLDIISGFELLSQNK